MRTARALLLSLLVCQVLQAAPIPLVKDGRSAAVIVINYNVDNDGEFRAAHVLRDYIERMSGARLKVSPGGGYPGGPIIFVGKHFRTEKLCGELLDEEHLAQNGYLIRTSGQHICISGHTWKGTRRGVYAFLEHLGCRFYMPLPNGEVIPRRRTIVVEPINEVKRPAFIWRNLWYNGHAMRLINQENWVRWYDWELKLGLGGLRVFQSHNLSRICPAEKYFETHPKYFPLIGGRRIKGGQLCVSNPDVVRLCAEAAADYFRRHPDFDTFSLSCNDYPGWCQCNGCRDAGTLNGKYSIDVLVLRYVNSVADLMAEDPRCRGKYAAYLAYYPYCHLRAAPVGLRARPNVLPILVNPICPFHPPDRCALGEAGRKLLEGWREVADRLLVYEWVQLDSVAHGVLSPQNLAVGPRFQHYHDHNVVGYSGEICGLSAPTYLRLYVGAKMMWDPKCDPQAILDEFFRLFFGSAREPMQQYYGLLNINYTQTDVHNLLRPGEVASAHWPYRGWSDQQFRDLAQHLDAATQQAASDEVVLRRISRERDMFIALRELVLLKRAADSQDATGRRKGMEAYTRLMAHLSGRSHSPYCNEAWLRTIVAARLKKQLEKKAAMDSAKGQEGHSDDATFGDLKGKYREVAKLPEKWRFATDPQNVGEKWGYFKTEHDDSAWKLLNIHEFWEKQGFPGYDGTAWYRVRVDLPENVQARPLLLFFGAVDEMAWVWVNGRLAGEHNEGPTGWDKRFSIDITEHVRPGRNVIAVKVIDTSLAGGIWKSVKLWTPRR